MKQKNTKTKQTKHKLTLGTVPQLLRNVGLCLAEIKKKRMLSSLRIITCRRKTSMIETLLSKPSSCNTNCDKTEAEIP